MKGRLKRRDLAICTESQGDPRYGALQMHCEDRFKVAFGVRQSLQRESPSPIYRAGSSRSSPGPSKQN